MQVAIGCHDFCTLIQKFWNMCSNLNFKSCIRYFLSSYSSPNGSLSKTMFLFHLKSSFCSRDIQMFVFPPSPLFLPTSHCLRAWFKINLKVYDIINSLNKNLITHFVWNLEKNKRYDIETLVIDTVLNKKHFYGKVIWKMCT